MRMYKGVWVAKGSALYEAMNSSDKKVAEKLFKESSARYAAMYSAADREWFANWKPNV